MIFITFNKKHTYLSKYVYTYIQTYKSYMAKGICSFIQIISVPITSIDAGVINALRSSVIPAWICDRIPTVTNAVMKES